MNQKILSQALRGGRLPGATAIAAAALLGGCVELPTAPTVAAMPSAYKPLEVFQADDVACRGYASQQVAGQQGGSYSYDYPYNLQYRYNVAYEQCMYSKGNQLPGYTPPVSSIAPPR